MNGLNNLFTCPKGCWQYCEYSHECMTKAERDIIKCPNGCLQRCEYEDDCLIGTEDFSQIAYLHINEATEFFDVPKGYLYCLANCGRLHLYKIGRHKKFFRKDELERFFPGMTAQRKKQREKNDNLLAGGDE